MQLPFVDFGIVPIPDSHHQGKLPFNFFCELALSQKKVL
jgi:hypothetical protein